MRRNMTYFLPVVLLISSLLSLPIVPVARAADYLAPDTRNELHEAKFMADADYILSRLEAGQEPKADEWERLQESARVYLNVPDLEVFYSKERESILFFNRNTIGDGLYRLMGGDKADHKGKGDISTLLSDGSNVFVDTVSLETPTFRARVDLFRKTPEVIEEIKAMGAELKDVLPETPISPVVERGRSYHEGKLGTSPVAENFRPSKKEDLPYVAEMPEAERKRLMLIALESIVKGEGVFSTLAAGASSRMNVKEAPPEAKALVAEMYGQDKPLESKAAVPIGKVDGKIFTFLGSFMTNVARFEEAVARWFGGEIKHNKVMILTNDDYENELKGELSLRDNYGVQGEIIAPHQALGEQYVATVADTKKLEEKLGPARFEKAMAKAKEVAADIEAGKPESVVMAGEKTPLGHGEYFHQMVGTGLLRDLMKKNVRWIAVRNIDNSAATFDEDWLVTLGLFLEQNLDFQAEVSPRMPGMKGGGLIVTPTRLQLTEDPSFEATWKALVKENKDKGLELIDDNWLGLAYAVHAFAQAGDKLAIDPTRMDTEGGAFTNLEEIAKAFKDLKVKLFRDKSGNVRVVRKVDSGDTAWFNDAVAIFRPEYLLHIYGKPGQTREGFLQEMENATPEELEAIAARGRAKFPTLVDPKPAKFSDTVAVKIETNMWQSTGVAGPEAKIKAVGVMSAANIKLDDFKKMTPEERAKIILHLRFLATKAWKADPGKPEVETYLANKAYIGDILEHVVHGELLPADLPRLALPKAYEGLRVLEIGRSYPQSDAEGNLYFGLTFSDAQGKPAEIPLEEFNRHIDVKFHAYTEGHKADLPVVLMEPNPKTGLYEGIRLPFDQRGYKRFKVAAADMANFMKAAGVKGSVVVKFKPKVTIPGNPEPIWVAMEANTPDNPYGDLVVSLPLLRNAMDVSMNGFVEKPGSFDRKLESQALFVGSL